MMLSEPLLLSNSHSRMTALPGHSGCDCGLGGDSTLKQLTHTISGSSLGDMGSSKTAKDEFLAAWEKIHGNLPPHMKSEFLRRSEVQEIVRYPRYAIQVAIETSPRLARILQELQRKWVITQAQKSSKAARNDPVKRKPHQNDGHRTHTRDLALEGRILPLPDNPASSRIKGSPGYRTGMEAELRHIAQKHKWF